MLELSLDLLDFYVSSFVQCFDYRQREITQKKDMLFNLDIYTYRVILSVSSSTLFMLRKIFHSLFTLFVRI